MITIPNQQSKKFSQTNSGDVFGTIYKSKNIDYSQDGYITLAKKAQPLYRELNSGTVNFSNVLAICFSNVGDLIVTSNNVYNLDLNNLDNSGFTPNSDSGGFSTPVTANGDGVSWNDRIYVTTSSEIKYWTGSSGANWFIPSPSISITSGTPHPLCVFESANYLAVTQTRNTIGLFNTSHTLIVTLTINVGNEIQWIVYRNGNLYIGTRNINGENGRMYIWNGVGSAPQASYDVGAESALSGCEYAGSIAVINSKGQLLLFNGGGFNQIGAFPVFFTDYSWGTNRMARRGMIADGIFLYMNIEGQVNYNNQQIFLPNQPSGLWVYDTDTKNLHHEGAGSSDFKIYSSVTNVDLSTDIITFGTSVETQTGESIVYTSSFDIGGITQNTTYYAIRITDTTFQVAKTYEDAINGIAIDLTSVPSSYGGKFIFSKGGDFGEVFNSGLNAGAVALVPEVHYDFLSEKVLYGMQRVCEDDVSINYSVLMSFSSLGENRGYLQSQRIYSDNIEDVFNNLILRMRKLFNDNDQAILKYRITERQFFPVISVTPEYTNGVIWLNTSEFTTTNFYFKFVEIGDEIEIISGAGAGFLAHITDITPDDVNNPTLYSVTIDETIPLITAGDTSHVIIDNFTKLDIMTKDDAGGYKQFSLPEDANSAKCIEFKLEIRGDEIQMEELKIVNEAQITN